MGAVSRGNCAEACAVECLMFRGKGDNGGIFKVNKIKEKRGTF